MGDFHEAELGGGSGITPIPPGPKVFTNEFLSGVIKKSLENGDLPPDHKLAIVGAVDEAGIRAVVSIQVTRKVMEIPVLGGSEVSIKIQSIVEHEWTGDNKAGAQLLFSVR